MDLTLDQLRVLDAIDRLGSFAAAGRELHRATSAVSYAVQGLEEAVGIELFDRSGHRARLTPAGTLVLSEGREVLRRASRLERLAEQLREQWEPRLSVVVDGVLPMKPLLQAARTFSREGIPTHAKLRVEYLDGVRHAFDHQGADLMIALDFVGDPSLVARPLPAVSMLLLAHRRHPLCGLDTVTRADLVEHVELVVEDSSPGGADRPGRLSLGSPHVFRLSDFHGKREALLQEVGFGWMPEHLVARDVASGRLGELPFEEARRQTFTPHLVARRSPSLGRAARRFVDLFVDAID